MSSLSTSSSSSSDMPKFSNNYKKGTILFIKIAEAQKKKNKKEASESKRRKRVTPKQYIDRDREDNVRRLYNIMAIL